MADNPNTETKEAFLTRVLDENESLKNQLAFERFCFTAATLELERLGMLQPFIDRIKQHSAEINLKKN
jgi:hypothetical protein